MTAHDKIKKLQYRLAPKLPSLNYFDVKTLRRAEMYLHRWCEECCGLDNGRASYCITRDDDTNIPYREFHPYDGGKTSKIKIPDRETVTLKRIRNLCTAKGLHYYYQTDPRGCALYISTEPMTDSNYSSLGYAICD